MKRGRNQRRRQGGNPNRALDSNGPDVRIRGTANQIYDKYTALARDAGSSGDRVKAESYLQHAEHYFRLIRSMQQQNQPQSGQSSNAPQSVEGDGDQPDVDEGRDRKKQDAPRSEGKPERAPRRRAGGDREDADDQGGAGAKADGGEEENAAPKPKRKRAPRKAAKDQAEREEPAAAE